MIQPCKGRAGSDGLEDPGQAVWETRVSPLLEELHRLPALAVAGSISTTIDLNHLGLLGPSEIQQLCRGAGGEICSQQTQQSLVCVRLNQFSQERVESNYFTL